MWESIRCIVIETGRVDILQGNSDRKCIRRVNTSGFWISIRSTGYINSGSRLIMLTWHIRDNTINDGCFIPQTGRKEAPVQTGTRVHRAPFVWVEIAGRTLKCEGEALEGKRRKKITSGGFFCPDENTSLIRVEGGDARLFTKTVKYSCPQTQKGKRVQKNGWFEWVRGRCALILLSRIRAGAAGRKTAAYKDPDCKQIQPSRLVERALQMHYDKHAHKI